MDVRQIGQYRIERELGQGGFGVVYLATDTRLDRPAAVKQLLPELTANTAIVDRFFNEAKAAAAIDHPGIVEIYDVGWHTDGSAYFAMKLLDGDSLAKRLRQRQLAISDAVAVARQIASALAAAHARGIVHRDLKPDNVILVADPETSIGERAVVLDFGIAKLCGDKPASQKTRTGMLMGTPAYMSPEQCRGAGEVDHRTDVYALGCMVFEMLAGRPPFVGAGPGEVMGMHQFFEPPQLETLRPDMPPELAAVVMRMLAKDPTDRLGDMTAVADALAPFTAARSMEHPAQQPDSLVPAANALVPVAAIATVDSRRSSKRRLGMIAAGAALATTGAVIAFSGDKAAPARLAGAIELRLGDCAPTSVTFVSGPRPQPFEATSLPAVQTVARTDAVEARAKIAHARAVAQASGAPTRPVNAPVRPSEPTRSLDAIEDFGEVFHEWGQPAPSNPDGTEYKFTVTGALERQIVRRYLGRNKAKFEFCFEKILATDPTVTGHVIADFSIEPTGTVLSATAHGISGDVSSCIAQIIKQETFPRAEQPTNVRFPLSVGTYRGASRVAEPPPQLPRVARSAVVDYRPGERSALRGLEAELGECLRLQDHPSGVAVIELGGASPIIHGIESEDVRACIAALRPADASPQRCAFAFGAMPAAEADGVTISASDIAFLGTRVVDLAELADLDRRRTAEVQRRVKECEAQAARERPAAGSGSSIRDQLARAAGPCGLTGAADISLGETDDYDDRFGVLRDRAKQRVLDALAVDAPLAPYTPLVVRPLGTTPMRIVTRVLAAVWESGENLLLAANREGEWRLLHDIALPIVPVPTKTGARWPSWRSELHNTRAPASGSKIERPRLGAMILSDKLLLGIPRDGITEVTTSAQLASELARFRGKEHAIQIAAEDDVLYDRVVEVIEAARRAGFAWELVRPSTLGFVL